MLSKMTLGQYYPTDSPIHRLDPRSKLAWVLLYLIGLFVAKDWAAYGAAAVFAALAIVLSRVPVGYMLRGLRPILFILLLSVSFNIFLTPGEVLWNWRFLRVTREGLVMAAKMGLRLVLLVLGTSLLTFTTTPNALTDGLESGLGFLKVIRVPVHEIAMMMTIALRFIPILAEETGKIQRAQMARGADFESGSIIRRAKALVPILVPLFVSAFRRAGDLAMAMEARCYHGGEGRTRMKPLKHRFPDYLVYLSGFAFIALMIIL